MASQGQEPPDIPGPSERLRRAAETAFAAADADEAHRLAIEALSTADTDPTASRALILENIGRYIDAGSLSWEHDYYEQSLAELRDSEPLATRVRVLCSGSLALVQRDRSNEGRDKLREALALVKRDDDPALRAAAYATASEVCLALGELHASISHTRNGRRYAIRSGQAGLVIRSFFNEARATYLLSGRIIDSLRIRRAGMSYAENVGQASSEEGNTLRISLVEDLIEGGYWEEARELLGRAPHTEARSLNEVEEVLVRCWLASLSDTRPESVPPLGALVSASSPLHAAYFLSLGLASATRLQDFAAVEELTARTLQLAREQLAPPSSGLYVVDALTSAIQAQTGRSRVVLPAEMAPARLLETITSLYPSVRRHVAASCELTDGVVEIAKAEVVRATEGPQAGHWEGAVSVFRRTHARARLTYALLRHGEAAIARGEDTRRAHAWLTEAHQIASRMGAQPWLAEITRLLRRDEAEEVAASSVAPHSSQASSLLSPRQREVISLLALGHTDREIAGLLGISLRTANAHVAHILTRLGVRNRAEAVAWFYQSDLADATGD